MGVVESAVQDLGEDSLEVEVVEVVQGIEILRTVKDWWSGEHVDLLSDGSVDLQPELDVYSSEGSAALVVHGLRTTTDLTSTCQTTL